MILADTFYTNFLLNLEQNLNSEGTFEEARMVAFGSGFGTTGSLSESFDDLNWETFPVVLNSRFIQNLWRIENGFRQTLNSGWNYGPRIARMEYGLPFSLAVSHLHSTFYKQVKLLKPDVLLVQDLNLFSPPQIQALKRHCKLLIGEIASPLPPNRFLRGYDLVFSALPPNVDKFRSMGVEAYYLPLGFDSRLIDKFPLVERDIDVVFIGSVGKLWDTIELLKAVAEHVPALQIYGPISRELLHEAGLLGNYHGQAWGNKMFEIFSRSKIVLNRHGAIVKNFAGNMRMYEATGMGCVLLSEANDFVNQLFIQGQEIVTYTNYDNAGQTAASLLENPEKLKMIGEAGKHKTLTSHLYTHRADFMNQRIIEKLESL